MGRLIHGPGNFEFINDKFMKKNMEKAWNIIGPFDEKNEIWDFLKSIHYAYFNIYVFEFIDLQNERYLKLLKTFENDNFEYSKWIEFLSDIHTILNDGWEIYVLSYFNIHN